jgi:branched-chain amino acid transport system substrate-binding protein
VGTRRIYGAVVCLAASIALAACGSSSSNSSSSSSSSSNSGGGATTTSSSASSAGPSQSTIAYGLKYTGGTAGKADPSKSPIKVGFTTNLGGTPSFPEQVAAAKATTAFINDKLGGIDGHPLQLTQCYMQSQSDGQKCGAEFLAAHDVVVDQALAELGNASLYSTVAPKIPVIVGTTSAGPDYTTKNVYSFTGGGPAVIYAMAKDAKDIGLKHLALLSVGDAGGTYTMQSIALPALTKLGVAHSKVVYYNTPATTPSIVSAIQAAGGTSADGIFLDPSSPTECTSVYDGLKQLGLNIPVITTPICNAPSFISATGSGPTNWRFWGFNTNPRVTSDPEVQVYNDIMSSYGETQWEDVGFASSTTRDLLTIAKFGNALHGDVTPATIKKQILAFRGPAFMIPGTVNCQDPPSTATPGACGSVSVGSTFKDGSWQSIPAIKVGS